ncbi:MAG: polysaccharide pyruvyl transferase family protein [Candidatus Gracilibacteria bacterium]|nr:polysaccharide pyruvyl transferase family protein [Candidatus Gracilibacteria bacterium]
MNFVLFTATGAYNLGDELILLQEYMYLKNRYPKATFSVFTYDAASSLLPEDSSIEYLSFFPHHLKKRPIRNIWYFLKTVLAIRRSDFIIVGGGGLLYDNEEGQSFEKLLKPWKLRVWLAKFFQKPIIYWSLGIHLKKENESKILPLFSGENIHISVRDAESKKTLESIGIKSLLLRDPVLSYDPEIPKLLIKHRPKIGLSFRSGFLQDEIQNIEKIITFLMANGYEPILLNHSFHPGNPSANDDAFLSSLKEKYRIHSTKDIQETLETYKELEFVIGMRLHSLILSFVHAIPFFAISYGKKTDEFIRGINYDYSLAARVFDIELFKKRFMELEKEKNEQKFALSAKNDTIKREIYITTNHFFDGLEKF